MKPPLVIVLRSGSPRLLGGMSLSERAILLAVRAGLTVRTWGPEPLELASRRRLASRGATYEAHIPEQDPLDGIEPSRAVIVVGADALFSPALLTELASAAESDSTGTRVVLDGDTPVLLSLAPVAAARVTHHRSLQSMYAQLAVDDRVRPWTSKGAFARVVPADGVATTEREYIRHLNGKESYFTKRIRRVSVPLTSHLVRLGARPAGVTLGGLILAIASAWCLAQGQYLWGVIGGALYYASMVFDCSDGEVARLSLRDSAFGAWFETVVDYSTYVFLWWALSVSAVSRPDARWLDTAADISIAGSILVIAVASYLRFRVAAADPGQFDEASAKAMESSTRLNRFARWGRQWIKRSSLAHLVLALALINQAPALLYLWAFGASVAAVVILAVQPFVVRRVLVGPTHVKST